MFRVQTCREEIDSVKTRLDKLTAVGRELMQTAAGDVRGANDIESRLARLSQAFSRLQHKHESRSASILSVLSDMM